MTHRNSANLADPRDPCLCVDLQCKLFSPTDKQIRQTVSPRWPVIDRIYTAADSRLHTPIIVKVPTPNRTGVTGTSSFDETAPRRLGGQKITCRTDIDILTELHEPKLSPWPLDKSGRGCWQVFYRYCYTFHRDIRVSLQFVTVKVITELPFINLYMRDSRWFPPGIVRIPPIIMLAAVIQIFLSMT